MKVNKVNYVFWDEMWNSSAEKDETKDQERNKEDTENIK
jgi:uncharacterized membrane protein